jgi:hypothetical protein
VAAVLREVIAPVQPQNDPAGLGVLHVQIQPLVERCQGGDLAYSIQ